jgi:hypothetical protein
MRKFILPFAGVATGVVADTYKTIVAAIAADTLGYRFWINYLAVFADDATPLEHNLALKLCRIADVSAGSAGTGTALTPVKPDDLGLASIITAKTNCTVEPTTYESTDLLVGGRHAKAGFVWQWDDIEGAPVANRDQLIGLLAAPKSTTAVTVRGEMGIVQF